MLRHTSGAAPTAVRIPSTPARCWRGGRRGWTELPGQEGDAHLLIAQVVDQRVEPDRGFREHLVIAGYHLGHVARQEIVEPANLHAVAGEEQRRRIARLQPVQDLLPGARECEL